MGIRGVVLCSCIAALAMSSACDLQSRKKSKLPQMPQPAKVDPRPADPTAWATRGDAVCPSINVAATTGAPGTTVRDGKVTRDPQTGTLRCQVDGRNHGPATDYEPNGTLASGNYTMGLRSGQWEGRFSDGRIAWKGSFIEGLQVGQWTHWDPDGELLTTGELRNGKRHGMWLYWDRPVTTSGDATRFEVFAEGRPGLKGVILDGKPVLTQPVCALGYASPRCLTILAAGITYRRGSDDRIDGGDANSASFDAAFTANVTERHGLGVQGSIYAGDEFARFGVRAAYRLYLADIASVEASGGLLFAREDTGIRGASVGQHARFELIVGDQFAIGTEITRYDIDGDGDNKLAGFFTVRAGLIPLAMVAYVVASIGAR